MALRLYVAGGHQQQDRMIHDKRESLKRALHFSYQSAEILQENSIMPIRALINPNKLKPDYDDKILSVDYEYGFKPGDIFEWKGTGTHWLIYLQDLTELAYFRGDIRKCNYQISWTDKEGNIQSSWIAIQGPVETKINFIQKRGLSLDVPNHSIHILMPKTESAIEYFQRYSKFYINDADDITNKICWRVEATDTISMPGILEINAVEYYSNLTEDNVEDGTVGGLIVTPEVQDESKNYIYGETFIKPKNTYVFIYRGIGESKWYIDPKYPIDYTIEDNKITLMWNKTYSGQFELHCNDKKKTIVVESLF